MLLRNRQQLGSFQNKLWRHQQHYGNDEHHGRVMNDYQSYYEPSNNIWSSSAQTGGNDRPSFEDLEALAFSRIGPGRYFTQIFATKCVRNGFDFYDWDGDLVKHKNVNRSLYKGKFYTEQIHWVNFDLIYGIGFLLKYWSTHDQYDRPPPNKPPLAYKAFPPTILSPINIVDTDMLWEDQDKWEFYGGKYKTSKIHPDRIEILCTRPNPYSWIGWSIFEPIYLSICAYLNLIVNGLKMLAKYSNVVTAFNMNVPNPSLEMYREFQKLIEDMKATFTFVLAKDEEIKFIDTKMGQGLKEFGEILKEDMAGGTGLPLNQVYGRADGGGLQGAGALISKQTELETMSNYQADLADNYWQLFEQYWNVDQEFVKFRLDYQKSDRARYEEENLQWQNEMMKANVEAIRLQNLMSAMEFQDRMNHPENYQVPDQSGGNVANQTGGGSKLNSPGNGGAKKLQDKSSIGQIKKANQDFINKRNKSMKYFKPRIVDIDFRE